MADTATMSRGRKIAVWTLIVLASLIMLVMSLTLWLKRQVLDNGSWRKASADLVQNEQVRQSLSVFIVDQLYSNVNVGQAISDKLPQNLKPLGPTLANALREPAANRVDKFLSRPKVQQLFVNASSIAQQKVVNVLEDKTGYGISTGNGVVTLDLRDLVTELATDLGLPQKVLDKIPADAGTFTVMTSDQLGAVQKGVKLMHVISGFLIILVLLMYGGAVYLASGRRRETLRNVGWSILLVSVILLIVRRFVGNYVVDSLTDPTHEKPVRAVWLIASSILGQIGRAGVLYGLLTVLGAVLAGPTRAATAVRRWLAPYLNERQVLSWVVLAALYGLVLLWGPTPALQKWWGIVIFGALIAFGHVALRRETMKEFPPVAPPAPEAPPVPAA